jgi:DNA-binding transcriptional ArsR family regulator
MSAKREINDAQTMRALAHPMRLALLDAIRRDGELTATRAAELLDDSPGNMSWHLQTLAKYGFIEEAPGGKGRSRPWKLVDPANKTISPAPDDPAANAAVDVIVEQVLQRGLDEARSWMQRRHTYPVGWQTATFLSDSLRYLTLEEMQEIREEILAVFDRYPDRVDKDKRPADALPIRLSAAAFPLPETPSGN